MSVRPTLGVWGPHPGQPSGVASYIASSLPVLERMWHPMHAEHGTDPDQFDQVLYHLGNNDLHHDAFQALAQRPGPVLLHEINILNYYYQAWERLPEHRQRQVLALLSTALGTEIADGDALEAFWRANPGIDPYSIDARIETLVLDAATCVLVHHQRVAELLKCAHPRARIEVIPFPVTPITVTTDPDVRSRYGICPQTVVFGSFGYLGEYKRIEVLLAAWQAWAERPDDALLLLVGAAQYAVSIPADASIRHIDHPDATDFTELLLSVDCAVQLRGPWLGESSGPVSTLLAHHRSAILTDIPTFHPGRPRTNLTHIPVGGNEVELLTAALEFHYRAPKARPRFDPAFHWSAWAQRVTATLTDPRTR
ncbi:hypothetical protein [Nocardia sp. NPDC060259]|uniref:hypothetical protein n=1 Tax=Nocardia sp. NPDC060259 TaxID=3347088 RepID=UPI0036597DF4